MRQTARLFATLSLFVVLGVVSLPAIATVREILSAGSSVEIALSARELGLLIRSLSVAALATALAIPWGLATSLLIVSLEPRRARWCEYLCYAPLLIPNVVVTLGWIYFGGISGVLTRMFHGLGLDTGSLLYSPFGVGFVLSLCNFPFVTLFCLRQLRQLDPSSIRAALLSAGPTRTALYLCRAIRPAIGAGAVLVFLLSFSDFGVASALMVNVFSVEVFVQLNAFLDHERAFSVLAVPIGIAIVLSFLRPRLNLESAGGAAPAPHTTPRWIRVIGLAAMLLSVAVPLTFLLVTSETPSNFSNALRIAGPQFLNSQTVALWSLPIVLLPALLFLWGHRSAKPLLKRLSEGLLLVLLVLPGGATGLGILWLKNRGVWPYEDLYPHSALLAYAVACRYLVFPVYLLLLVVPAPSDTRIRAARVVGARTSAILRRILAPLLGPAAAMALAIVAVLSLGELSAAVLLNPPDAMTLPVRLSSLLHFGEDSIVAALCLTLVAFIVGVLALGHLLGSRRWHGGTS